MKKAFLAVIVDYTGNKSLITGEPFNGGKPAYYAFVVPIRAGEDVVSVLGIIGGLLSATLCESRKQADDLTLEWTRGFREKGEYAF